MRINKYLPFAFIYFFINAVGLPFGLTYTALLSPLLYWWVITNRKKEILLPFVVCLTPFVIIHVLLGVDIKAYLISIAYYTTVYIFCQAFYTFLPQGRDIEKIFRYLLIGNFILCLIAIPVYFTSFSWLLWMDHTISDGIDSVSRLKLFTYEASFYAVLFAPLFLFYFVQLILRQNTMNSWLLLLMLLLPYVLSFSIGAIGALLIATVCTFIMYARRLLQKKRVLNLFVLTLSTCCLAFLVLWVFFPKNDFFLRLGNIISGKDTSGNGRTSEAFMLAMEIIKQKSMAWGIGAGQVKILGADIIRSYYLYDLDYNTIAIPNAAAETLAIFGWVGLCLRIAAELFFFFYTKVWKNYYRLMLFIFIFIYQFTGSFITNIAEYVIWILAFTNAFPQFNVTRVFKKSTPLPQ